MKNKKTPGQVVVIITLFIAVMILFAIVLINVAKVSDIKTTTSQVSDAGALNLGSQLGSYVNLLNKKIEQRVDILSAIIWGTCAPNWGLIFVVIGLIFALILAPLATASVAITALLSGTGLAFLTAGLVALSNINSTQQRAFSSAIYSMTAYTGFRESVITTMLGSIQTDSAIVTQVGGATSPIFQDNNPGPTLGKVYDLTNNPGLTDALEEIRHNKPVYRYYAWYWADRFPMISEFELLMPLIDENTGLIKTILDHTKIEYWDPNLWEIQKLSLKVGPEVVTRTDPPWVIVGDTENTDMVRVVGPIKLNDWLSDYSNIINLFTKENGFLTTKFVTLTERLILAGYNITYSKKEWWQISLLGINLGFKHDQIFKVNDDIRGFLTRSMELMNLPVSYRVLGITSWLPNFYTDLGESMYTRLIKDHALVQKWIDELTVIQNTIQPLIPPDWGTHCCQGYVPSTECPTDCCDGKTCCCGTPMTCTWKGTYCTCNSELPSELCTHGDLYGNMPVPCPIPPRCPGCACDPCTQEENYPQDVTYACRFQGDLTWLFDGQTEVRQALDILEDLNKALGKITCSIKKLADGYKDAMVDTQLKRQAVYGWVDKNDVHHVIQVMVDDYPAYDNFPILVEEDAKDVPFSLLKCWYIKGAVDGWIKTTVSSYASDIPAGWWNLRTRRSVDQPEYDKTRLGALIAEIHTRPADRFLQLNAHKVDFDALMQDFAIRSATKGHWGANKKNQIYIQRDTP